MSINPKADIQDIESSIEIWKESKNKKYVLLLQRIFFPLTLGESVDEIIEHLEFKKKQLEEEIKFNKYIKNKYHKKKNE
jgi:hypothetical protein